MGYIKNMSIKGKLLAGFLIVASVALIVGYLGVAGLLELNENEDILYREGVELLTEISGMDLAILGQRLELRGMIISIDDEKAVEENINNMRAFEDEFDGRYRRYLDITSGADATENEIMQRAMAIYNGPYKELKAQLVQSIQTGDEEGVRTAYVQTGSIAKQASESLHEMVTYGAQRAARLNDLDQEEAYKRIGTSVALTSLLVALAVVLGLFTARLIAKPLAGMADTARVLAEGDIGVSFSYDSNDEIGALAKGFEKMVEAIKVQAALLELVSHGDYTVTVPIRSDKDTVNRAIRDLVSSGGEIMAELKAASGQVTAASGQISQAAQGLASGSSEQAASIEEFTATLVELQEKTNHNAANSSKAREANEKAADQLQSSMQSMYDLLGAMKSIDESSESITKVIKVIDDIAFQTNILALNAAVEAARAGQHGKGFAVVADEVRNLAAKSAEAAKETAILIEGSAGRVKEGNQIVERTNDSLKMVIELVRSLNALVEEVADESADQAKAIKEINAGVAQISSVVQANSATAEQSAAAAQELSAQAVMLNEIVARFKLKQAGSQQKVLNIGTEAAASRERETEARPNPAAGFALAYGKY